MASHMPVERLHGELGACLTPISPWRLDGQSLMGFITRSMHTCCGLGHDAWLNMDENDAVVWWNTLLTGGGTSSVVSSPLLSAKSVGLVVFVDSQRKAALKLIIPKLRKLFLGRLVGQNSCFVFVGPRGVGKSTFLLAMAATAAEHAPAKSLIMYTNWKSNTPQRPSELILEALKHHHAAAYQDRAGDTIDDVHDLLSDHNISCVLVIDELERLYTCNNEAHTAILQELYAIGDNGGTARWPRRIIIIATGNAAVLPTLVFNLNGYPELRGRYPLHGQFSLNNTKYVAIMLRPLCTRAEAASAIAAYAATDDNFKKQAVAAGPVGCSGADDVDEAALDRHLMLSRGMMRYLVELPCKPMARKDVLPYLQEALRKQRHGNMFHHLFNLWKQSLAPGTDVTDVASKPDQVAKFAVTRDALGGCCNLTGPALYSALYEAVDNQVLWYDSQTGMASFLHPYDPASFLLSDCGPENSVEGDKDLTDAEKLSLGCPDRYLPRSADEL